MKITHRVIKEEDIKKYLNTKAQQGLNYIISIISMGREFDGKPMNNEYLVINRDEPYAEEIIEILKKNGHWDEDESET